MKNLIVALLIACFASVAFARDPDVRSVTGFRKPLGYQQFSTSQLNTSVGITIPALPADSPGPGFAVIQCQAGAVRWRDDGVGPTATVGMTILQNAELTYVGQIQSIVFVTSTGSPICDVNLYE